MARTARLFLVMLLAILGAPRTSFAADPPTSEPREKRPVQDFDQRGSDPTTPGEVLLWGPRVVMLPPYLVSEYVVRKPIGALVTYVEKRKLIGALYNLFTFGPGNNIGIVPTALFDFGLLPSVGLYMFWDHFLTDRNDFRLHAATWGDEWLAFTGSDRLRLDDKGKQSLTFRGEFYRRSDLVFAGMGPSSRQEDRSRYDVDRVDTSIGYDTSDLWRASTFSSAIGVRAITHWGDDAATDDPSIRTQIDNARFPAPPGFDHRYAIVYQRFALALDTRHARPAPGDGVRLELNAQPAFQTNSTNSWINYGGSIGVSHDITKQQRVISLTGGVQFSDPLLKDSTIPFTEQVTLGGTGAMRGFLPGRLVDRSSAVATLQYTWPIWVFLDGAMHLSIGNVFGKHLEDLELRKMRLSTGIGFRTNNSRDHSFELMTAFGTDTFEQGTRISSVRIVIGANRGF
jgi:Omp85 superfamily domain